MRRILSIDGGGIRGIIPAIILSKIEIITGKPISDCFDLVAGTSTGGILALGLSKDDGNGRPRYSAAEMSEIYKSHGKDMFSRTLWKRICSIFGINGGMYTSRGIEKTLDTYFGHTAMKSALTKTLVTSYDINNRTPVFLKSWKEEYFHVQMKHAARATSAAPTYFEPVLMSIGNKTRVLIDGGVFINNPAASAYAEAKKIFPNEADFFVLSLGTGQVRYPISYSDAKSWGKIGWMIPLLSCIFDGQVDTVDYQMDLLLSDKYVRLQPSLLMASEYMDNITSNNIEKLTSEAEIILRANEDKIRKICNFL